tara:strand:+ start:599 stop:799 length:201 start_codon:yes stop_codon:yes gene_type:complete
MKESETISETIEGIQSSIDALKDAQVLVQELKADYQVALKLLAECENERRIAVAQVVHFKEVLAKK